MNPTEYKFIPVDFDPFGAGEIEKVIPTIESQKEIWLSCVIGGVKANLAYNESISLDFHGNLQTTELKESLETLLLRHESLRASFSTDGSNMIISTTAPLKYVYFDLSTISKHDQSARIEEYHKEDIASAFDLKEASLIKFTLFKKSAQAYLFTIKVHHIICDGWSIEVLLKDLSDIYTSKCNRTPLPHAPLLFSDYALQSLEFSKTKEHERIEEYWIGKFKENVPFFEVPTDFPRPASRTYQSRRDDFIVDTSTVDALKKTGAQYGCSLVNILMSALEVLLYKHTGHETVMIGLPAAGQSAAGMFNLVGHCVNLLPLRSTPDDQLPFKEYLKIRKTQTLDDYEYQQYSFGTLLKKINYKRDPARMPLVPVSFNLDAGLDDNIVFEQLTYDIIDNPRVAETFELFLNIVTTKEGYTFQWSYNTLLYKPSTIKRFMEKYLFLISEIINNPERKIKDLQLEDKEILRPELLRWNDTHRPIPEPATITNLLDNAVGKYANRIAVTDGDEQLTYKQLSEKSNQVAHYLSARNIGNGDIVGVAMERSADLIIALLGIVKAGAAFLPLDPQYAQSRIAYMLDNSKAKLLITSAQQTGKFNSQANEICFKDILDKLQDYPSKGFKASTDATSLVYILYTSGSTGRPKGVMIGNKSLVNYVTWASTYYLNGEKSAFPLYTSISFDLTITSIFVPLVNGNQIIVYPEVANELVVERVFTDHNVNVIKLTPSHLRIVSKSQIIKNNLPTNHLKLIVGGEELGSQLCQDIQRLFSGNVEIFNEYGPTEATIGCMIHKFDANESSLPSVPIGVPIDNCHIYLLDDSLQPVADESIGEIYIGGDCLAKGYYLNDSLTKERFIDNPFLSGQKMYKTGDNAIMLSNNIVLFKGRTDDQVKLRGHRIELGEINYQISQLPGVQDVATLLLEDIPEKPRLVSYLVLDEELKEINTIIDEIKRKLKQCLPEYMIPSSFVSLPQLPLTVNGKVDKKKLPSAKANDIPLIDSTSQLTLSETLVRKIWQEELGINNIQLNDNFFELGGHSLAAVHVLSRIYEVTNKDLPFTTIFHHPTVGELAKVIDGKLNTAEAEPNGIALHDITVTGNSSSESYTSVPNPISLPILESQREIWISCQIDGKDSSKPYNLTLDLSLEGVLNELALKSALNELVKRHEALRTTFSEDGEKIHIHAHTEFDITTTDISFLTQIQQKQWFRDFEEKRAEFVFDLVNGPLFTATIIKVDNTVNHLSLFIHHIICDGWSLDLIVDELNQLYLSFKKDNRPNLGEASKFSDYIQHKQSFYRSATYHDIEKYWQGKYKDQFPSFVLPTENPRPTTRTYRCETQEFSIDRSLSESLKHIGGSSTSINLLVLFEILFGKITGNPDVVIGVPIAGQLESPKYRNLVGHYVNVLPIYSQVNQELSFTDYIAFRAPEIVDDYSHGQYTFGTLIQEIAGRNDHYDIPLLPVIFNYKTKDNRHIHFDELSCKLIANQSVKYDNFEIAIEIIESDKGFEVRWTYNVSLFNSTNIVGFHSQFEALMNAIIADPSQPLKSISLIKETDLEKIRLWNDTYSAYDKSESLHGLFTKIAQRIPDKIAIKCNENTLTYQELENQSNKLAQILIDDGIQPGDAIAVCLGKSCELVIALLGILKAGGLYIPIEPSLPETRISYMVRDAGSNLVITTERLKYLFDHGIKLFCIDQYVSTLRNGDFTDFKSPANGDCLAYMIYTSGSTGRPKGVKIRHRNAVNFLLSFQKRPGITMDDRMLMITPISFDMAGILFLPLVSEALLVMMDDESAKDGRLIYEEIEKEQITWMVTTPTLWKIIIDSGWNGLKTFTAISGGEAFTKEIAELLLNRCTSVWNGYGPTETTQAVTLKHITSVDEPITIGHPIQNTQIHILDNYGNQLPIGAAGEICISGDCVGAGYNNLPTLTEKHFVQSNIASIKSEIYRSGDLGKILPNGEILYLGRIDTQVKIRGLRVELGEIESLLNEQEGVKQAIVDIQSDEYQNKSLVAYLVLNRTSKQQGGQNVQLLEDELTPEEKGNFKTELAKILPGYMIPAQFVAINRAPLTKNGKTDRSALPVVPLTRESSRIDYSEPKTSAERLLVTIWSDLLHITTISIHDNFFELGGNSLLAVRVMLAVEKEKSIRLPLTALFKNPTIREFSTYLDNFVAKNAREAKDNEKETLGLLIEPIIQKDADGITWLPTIDPQREIWVASEVGGDEANLSYNLSISLRFRGNFDSQAFNRALNHLVTRHEALRSKFNDDGGMVGILEKLEIDLSAEDISGLSGNDQNERIAAYAEHTLNRPFDLQQAPLFRAALFKLKDDYHHFAFVIHHIIADGWSLSVLQNELRLLYNSYVLGEGTDLPPAHPLREYLANQHAFYQSPAYKNMEAFWLAQYEKPLTPLNLPTDFPRSDEHTYRSSTLTLQMDQPLFKEFKQVYANVGGSIAVNARAVLEILISKLARQNDIVTGMPVAGHVSMQNQSLIAQCVNTLPLRARVDGSLTFQDYLSNRKQSILEAYENDKVSFVSLARQLRPHRNSSNAPLVSIFFDSFDMDMEAIYPSGETFHGLSHEVIDSVVEHSNFDFFITISGSVDRPVLDWMYNTQLFKESSVKSMMENFNHLMLQVTKNPQVRIDDLQLKPIEPSPTTPRNRPIEQVNDKPFFKLLDQYANIQPDKTAIICGDRKISYDELEKQSNRFAAYLIDSGVKRGDVIAIILNRVPELVPCLLGILKAGAAYLPIDPTYPVERIEFMLEDSNVSALVTTKGYKGEFQASSGNRVLIEDIWPQLADFPSHHPNIPISGQDLVYIIYTSGSTGKPKGVQIEHGNLLNFLLGVQRVPGITSDDVLLSVTTISFDPVCLDLYLPLITGGTVVIADEESRLDGKKLIELVEQQNITMLQATPITWRMMLDAGWTKKYNLRAFCGGEPFPPDLAEKLLVRCAEVWNLYGPTETTVWSTVKRVVPNEYPITVGKPIDNVQLYVLDENMQPVATGQEGELYIAGNGVARGYQNRPELNEKHFLPNPFSENPKNKIYRTGDLAKFLDNGELLCLGRIDTQVKIRGHRIELGEIESILNKQEGVQQAVVKVQSDEKENKSLVAYLVLSRSNQQKDVSKKHDNKQVLLLENELTITEKRKIKAQLAKILPAYMLPAQFAAIDYVPFNKNGKVDRKALPAVSLTRELSDVDYIEPTTKTEQLLCTIWSDFLNVENISIHDNFFDLGGHSIIAINVLAAIKRETGTKLPLAIFFKNPTIQKLARLIDGQDNNAIKWNSLVAIKPSGSKPPLYIVHGGGLNVLNFHTLIDLMDPEQPIYGIQSQGLEGNNGLPPADIKKIAEHYLSEILEHNPNGPYFISGFSYGGIVAFEMAHQLKAKGKKIAFLGFFDTLTNKTGHQELLGRRRYFSYLVYLLLKIAYNFYFLLKYGKEYLYTRKQYLAMIFNRLRKQSPMETNHIAENTDYNNQLQSIHYKALDEYRLEPLDCHAYIFKANTLMMYNWYANSNGWKPYLLQGYTVASKLKTSHSEIFSYPAVKTLAKKLQHILDSCAADDSR